MLQAFSELRTIHRMLGEAEGWLLQHRGVPICIEKCGKCCEINTVPVHSIEASMVVSYIIGAGKTEWIDWCRNWLIERHPQAPTYGGMPKGVTSPELTQEWKDLQRTPCIFLSTDKRCLIYEFRPLPCRTFGVTRIPTSYCPRPLAKAEMSGQALYVGGRPALILIKETQGFLKRVAQRNPDWAQQGFLPAMIMRQAREKEFRDLIADNRIASAKLVGTAYSLQSLWQYQVELEELAVSGNPVNLVRA